MVHGSAKSITQKQSIPEEILLLILSYVEKCSEQFANLCAVSKYIYSLASVDIFWERIWSKRYNTKKVTKNYRFAFIQLQQVHEIQEQLKAQQNTTVAVLGAANIGKSALVLRICRGQYMENFYPTISDRTDKRLQTRFGCVHLFINDCSFQDDTRQIIDVWVRASKAFVLVCSLTDRKTLPPVEEIVNRIELVKDVDKGGANIILAANQCDDEEHREITEQEVKEFCTKNGIRYWFEVSAKTDENVTELFTCAAELGTDVLEKQHELVKKLENGIPIVPSKKKCTIL